MLNERFIILFRRSTRRAARFYNVSGNRHLTARSRWCSAITFLIAAVTIGDLALFGGQGRSNWGPSSIQLRWVSSQIDVQMDPAGSYCSDRETFVLFRSFLSTSIISMHGLDLFYFPAATSIGKIRKIPTVDFDPPGEW